MFSKTSCLDVVFIKLSRHLTYLTYGDLCKNLSVMIICFYDDSEIINCLVDYQFRCIDNHTKKFEMQVFFQNNYFFEFGMEKNFRNPLKEDL